MMRQQKYTSDRSDLMPELRLAAAVLRLGLDDIGPRFLETEGGRFWADLADIDPAVIARRFWHPPVSQTR